jgi:phthiodiolone/phenolphthiodiolone dimycocerosates ketoreductase
MERKGFDSVWVGDHLVEVNDKMPTYDPWCLLSVFATITKKLLLGTCVTDAHRRHPAVLAQAVATVDQISNGRVILGIGAGESMNLTPFGIPWENPVSRMKEAVEIIRLIWTGENISYRGKFYELTDAYVSANPVQKPHPPIYIAGGSSRSRRLAGNLGDGWISMMMTPEMFRQDLREVEAAAKEAGRTLADIDVVYAGPIAISRSHDEAREAALKAAKTTLLYWPQQLQRYGFKVTDEFDWLKLTIRKGSSIPEKVQNQLQKVPSDLAERISVFGTPEDCIKRIEDYAKAGVTHFMLHSVGNLHEFDKLFPKVIAYFKEMQPRLRN